MQNLYLICADTMHVNIEYLITAGKLTHCRCILLVFSFLDQSTGELMTIMKNVIVNNSTKTDK